jgi:glycosyltransferase involved in cell wall biosynthesis
VTERPILWLHSHFLLPTGGTKFIYEVTRRVAAQRPIEVLVDQASPYWRDRYQKAGVPLRELGSRTSTSMLYWLAFPAFLRRNLHPVERAAAGAGVIVSSFFPMQWLGGRAAAKLGLRHVHLCFEPFPFFYDAGVVGMYPLPKRALLRWLALAYSGIDRKGVASADSLLTLNDVTAGAIEQVYGINGAVPTQAGVDTDVFRPYNEVELADLRARHGQGPIAVHSTDFSPIKRTDLALRAFATSGSPGRLLITSTIDDARGLASMRALAAELGIADRVEFLGFVPYEDLPRYYSLADVLIQTGTSALSGATSMALPVKEAMACGTAVVRSSATDEDVEDGVSGYLVDPADVEQTGARIRALLEDRERSRAMGEAARTKIVGLYSWERVVDVVLAAAA